MAINLDLVETDELVEALLNRFDSAGFVGQRLSAEDDYLERIEMHGKERVVQGLCLSLAMRCEQALVARSDPTTY